ncbi:MAG: GerMN domain-containing protein [Erysipelotrichaceae bacterium]
MIRIINYKKQIIFLFAALGLISYLSIKMIPNQKEENLMVIANLQERNIQVYLYDQEHTVVPISMKVDKEMKTEEKMKHMIKLMSENHPPFYAVFNQDTKLKNVEIDQGCVTLNFNKHFNQYNKSNELRMLEAITWGTTQFDGINQLKIKVDDKLIEELPKAKTAIPNPCNREMGINNFESAGILLHKSKPLTVFYTKSIKGKDYYLPKSKRIDASLNGLKENIQAVMDDISATSGLKQPLYSNDIQMVEEPYLENGTLVLTLNENILSQDRVAKQDAYETLILSMAQINGVKMIKVLVDDVVISLHGSNEEVINVSSLSYNRYKY